jgi:F-type H+-transporting ATPase subunit gamma
MANLLDLRRRIKSVKNTQQITKAMKMLSAVNLRRAQERVTNARPFAAKMTEVLTELANHTDENYHHPLLDVRGDSRYLLVLITADKGLAGAFNANLIKAAQAFLKENADKTVLQQRVVVEQILPVARAEEESQDTAQGPPAETHIEYIYEQPPAEIFGRLLPRLIETRVFRALLESIASEQGARMTAMDAASKNAGDLIGALTLNMNRIRQAAITTEIIEVVSGSAAAQS